MQRSLSVLTEHIGRMDQRMTKMETNFSGMSAMQAKSELGDPHFKDASGAPFQCNAAPPDQYDPNDAPRDHITRPEPTPMQMMAEDELEAEPGPPVPPGKPAIPINHTTLNSLLLEWPSIRELTKHHVEREGIQHINEFPISQEQNRGLLIVYGRGEDSNHARANHNDHGTLDMADDAYRMGSSPFLAADWDQLGGLSPPDQIDYRGGVLGAYGNPDFSEARVWSYVESFKDNILNMHPIVQPRILESWVNQFLDALLTTHPGSLQPQSSKPGFAVGNNNVQTPTETTVSKRKRSPGSDGSNGPSTPGPPRSGKPNRSIHSALVLTVLALGKICMYRDKVPDAVHTDRPAPHGRQMHRNGALSSPSQGSPPGCLSHSHSSGLPSLNEQERDHQTRRSSIHGPGGVRIVYGLKKNYEVIPGLEYFACATDILGNHTGAYNMKNVYANIFAGLYQGQLARPMESFAFIHKASHKLQVIMRP